MQLAQYTEKNLFRPERVAEALRTTKHEIAATPGFEYFRLDAHHENWKRVRDDFDFALSLPKVESADVRLYVVTGGS